MWGAEPPATATAQVHNSIAALRRNLVDADGRRAAIVRSSAGFAIRLEDDRCDAVEFARLANEADGLIDRDEYAAAGERLRAALDLWRGAAVGGAGPGGPAGPGGRPGGRTPRRPGRPARGG